MKTTAVLAGAASALSACGEGVRSGDGSVGVMETIGSPGGEIAFKGVRLTLPAGALDHDIPISVSRTRAPERAALDSVIDILPSPTNLSRTATLAVQFTLPPGKNALAITLGVLNLKSWRPVPSSQIDGNDWVSAQIVQLSTYAPVLTCGNNDECPSARCDSGVCQP